MFHVRWIYISHVVLVDKRWDTQLYVCRVEFTPIELKKLHAHAQKSGGITTHLHRPQRTRRHLKSHQSNNMQGLFLFFPILADPGSLYPTETHTVCCHLYAAADAAAAATNAHGHYANTANALPDTDTNPCPSIKMCTKSSSKLLLQKPTLTTDAKSYTHTDAGSFRKAT